MTSRKDNWPNWDEFEEGDYVEIDVNAVTNSSPLRGDVTEMMKKHNEILAKDDLIFSTIHSELKKKYPEKFHEEDRGYVLGKNALLIVGEKIRKEEVFNEEVLINGKKKKYKVTLMGAPPIEYSEEEKAEKEKIKLKNKESTDKDSDNFKSMFKWVGLIILIIGSYYLLMKLVN